MSAITRSGTAVNSSEPGAPRWRSALATADKSPWNERYLVRFSLQETAYRRRP